MKRYLKAILYPAHLRRTGATALIVGTWLTILNQGDGCVPGAARGSVAGAIVSVDLFYDDLERLREHEAIAVEMEAAALFALGASSPAAIACLLCVSDTFTAERERRRIDAETLRAAVERMGTVALAALAY